MSSVQRLPLQSYTNTETTVQATRQARNDPLDLDEYVMPGNRHPQLHSPLQSPCTAYQPVQTSTVPMPPYTTFISPFQGSVRDGSDCDGSGYGQLSSSTGRRGSPVPRQRSFISDLPYLYGEPVTIVGHRTSISSSAPPTYMGKTISSGGSSTTSHVSVKEEQPLHGPLTEDTGMDGTIQGHHDNVGNKARKGQPSWSDLRTKAGKERKRLPLACIACRRKKIRCSGEKPACKHCLRSRIPCVYKVTTRKAVPRTDYMAMLDKRLRRMEDRVIKCIPKDEVRDLTAIGRATVKPEPSGSALKNNGSKKRAADEAFGVELEEWSKSKESDESKPPCQPVKVQEVDGTQLRTEGADFLPSKEIQEHLSDVFFDFVYGQSYHLLHKPSFMRELR